MQRWQGNHDLEVQRGLYGGNLIVNLLGFLGVLFLAILEGFNYKGKGYQSGVQNESRSVVFCVWSCQNRRWNG